MRLDLIEYLNYTIELDVYHGLLENLLVGEIEFESLMDAQSFVPPDWFGREVTEDERYKNKSLVIHGLPEDFNEYK